MHNDDKLPEVKLEGDNYLIVTCVTKNTSYVKEVMNLTRSLDKFGLLYMVHQYESRGSWLKNIHYKADFIEKCLDKYDFPIVWLDADAVVMKKPELFDVLVNTPMVYNKITPDEIVTEPSISDIADIAVFYRTKGVTPHLVSATMFFRPTPATKECVRLWKYYNTIYANRMDQANLEHAIEDCRINGLKVYELPPEYNKIFDLMKDDGGEPVIQQNQASRQYKREVNK